jgi:hypothetical protein
MFCSNSLPIKTRPSRRRAVIEGQGDDFLGGVDARHNDAEELKSARITDLPERNRSDQQEDGGDDQKLFFHG